MASKRYNIFEGSGGCKPRLASLIYLRLMTRKWMTYADVIVDYNGLSSTKELALSVSKYNIYGELKKAFMDVRDAIKNVVGENSLIEEGNNRNKRYKYIGNLDDPLAKMRQAKAIKDIRRYYEFCQDSAGFFPTSWLDYFLKDSRDLLNIKQRRSKGGQIISASVDRQLKNIDMLPYLYEAIRGHRVLSIRYKPYDEQEMMLTFHPHFMKEYNGRWHILGHVEGKMPENGFNLAIDRIVDMPQAIENKQYIAAPEHFYENFFKDLVGVTHKEGGIAKDVRIRAYTNYIFNITDTKPIHKSQYISIPYGEHEDGEYGEFVVHVEINNEFIGRILMMGDKLEVVAPTDVRGIFKKRVSDLAKRYSDN